MKPTYPTLRILPALLAILLLLLTLACTRRPLHQPTYDRVSRIIDSLPDQALAILDSIPTSELQPGLDSARYILLHATAENKVHNFTTKESALKYPVKIFKSLNERKDLFQAYYILGRYQELNEQYDAALKNLLQAEALIDNSTTEYQKGLLYHELAECSNAVFSTMIALEYITKAEEAYKKANLDIHVLYALDNHGLYLNNIGRFKESEKMFTGLLKSAEEYDRNDLKMSCYDGLARSYIGQKNYKQALKYLRLLENKWEGMDEQTYGLLVLAENRAGDKTKADSMARAMLADNNPWVVQGLDPSSADADTILKAFSLFEGNMNSLLSESGADIFPWALKENYNLRIEIDKVRLQNQRLWNIILLSALVLCLVGIAMLISRHNKKIKKQKLYIDTISRELTNLLRNQNLVHQQTDSVLDSLLKQHSETINKLAKACYGKTTVSTSTEKLASQLIEEIIAQLSGNEKSCLELEEMINVKYNNAVVRLKEEVPDIREEEVRLFVLCASGFSNLVMAKILNVGNVQYLSVKKTFLRTKIKESGIIYQNEFLALIG